jgi:multidrug efflux pump subunit AcrA (membrane-fusion protein)
MKVKVKWITWGIVALVVLLAGYRISTKLKPEKKKDEVPVVVQVQTPAQAEALNTLALSGTVSAKEEANAYSKVPGKLVRYVRAEGDPVKKNDIIAWVERDEIGLTYSLSPVKAPVSGVVAERYIDIGESVASGMAGPGTPVARVVNPNTLELVVHVVEKELGLVRTGQPARIRVQAYPQEVFTGTVRRISPIVNRMSRTVQVKIRLEQSSGKLKSGMLADVEIIVGSRDHALLVPRDAVLKQNRREFVYLVEGSKAVRRDVETGWLQQDTVEIKTGLQAKDVVIVRGQTRVTEGMTVQTTAQGD